MSTASTNWQPPVPLGSKKLPSFPVDALPPVLADFVRVEAIATQTPADLAGGLALAVCGASIAGRVVAQVREGWNEPPCLFVVVVLDSGNRKSAVLADVTRPLVEFETAELRRLTPKIHEADARRRIAEKRVRYAEKLASEATSNRRRLEQKAIAASKELASIRVPPAPRLFGDDVTPEKLGALLSEHNGHFALFAAEGGVFELMDGRYTKNSTPNFDVFLKGHSGDTLRVDRLNRPPDLVARPALTLGLTVQPDVLLKLRDRAAFRGRGLLARFLYSLPASAVGRRVVAPPPVPECVRTAYDRTVNDILSRFARSDTAAAPELLRFSAGAAESLEAFEAEVEPQLGPWGILGAIPDWGAKLCGAVARLSAILHVVDQCSQDLDPLAHDIDSETVGKAVQLGRYYSAHARAAFGEMGTDGGTKAAQTILRWIVKGNLNVFSERDAHQSHRGRFPQGRRSTPSH